MTLTGSIDDVRIFPSDALMTTYAYNPLIGMTASTDPNGKTTYFDFDKIGRLKNVKDNKGDIVKNYFYNYGAAPTGLPSLINFRITSGLSSISINVTFKSKTTGQLFSVNAAALNTYINLPPDVYDISFTPVSVTQNMFVSGCGFSATGTTVNFYNISVSPTCNLLSIFSGDF